ncbi:MAG: sensor histidine kinase [Micromonosporaceae bacterium]
MAAESIDRQPERAREAIESVRTASQDALADLRSTIAVLRAPTPENGIPQPAPGLDQLPDLVDAVRATDVAASLQVRGDTTALRPTVELAVYRVVQESLTNALRHSGAGSVEVVVESGRDEVRVTIRDDGTRVARVLQPDQTTGSGLRGMTERVAALGGKLHYGPAGDGKPGWAVRARMPAGGTPWR